MESSSIVHEIIPYIERLNFQKNEIEWKILKMSMFFRKKIISNDELLSLRDQDLIVDELDVDFYEIDVKLPNNCNLFGFMNDPHIKDLIDQAIIDVVKI